MKKNHYKSLITLLVVIFITVLSCSRDDGEDEQVPNIPNTTAPTNNTNPTDNGNRDDSEDEQVQNIPNTTALTNDTNPTDNGNNTDSTINNNPSLYNLYQAQSFMHWLNPTDTCSIGYDINPYKNLRSKACGIESEKHECKSCRNPSFGVEGEVTLNKFTTRRDYTSFSPKEVDITGTCYVHLNEVKNEYLKNGISPNSILKVDFLSGYYTNGLNVFHVRGNEPNIVAICYYMVELKEQKYNEAKNCKICGSIDETTYKQCRHPSHGTEETVLKSSLDLSKQDVERLEGKVLGCKTCDDIKFDILNMDEENDTQLVNRITCLLNNLDSSDTNNEDKQGIITELKRLTVYSELINKTHPDLYAKVKEHI